jgi:serpin B
VSSTPEPSSPTYTPTSPDILLTRVKSRSAALQRKRWGVVGGSTVVVVALVLGTLVLQRPGPKNHVAVRPSGKILTAQFGSAEELTADVLSAGKASAAVTKEAAEAEVGFSLRLLGQMSSSSGNVLLSPSSLSTALAMLELGARGATAQGIANALSSSGMSASQQAAGWHTLAMALIDETARNGAHLGTTPELNIANAVWVQHGLQVEPGFVRAMTSEFAAGVWQVNFGGDMDGAINSINAWTSKQTQGLIKKLFSPGALSNQTVMVLADAVYFQAHWARSFLEERAPFHFANGSTSNLPTLQSSLPNDGDNARSYLNTIGSNYDAVEIPYSGKSLSALVLMPTAGNLAAFVNTMTPASLGAAVSALHLGKVRLTMPEFTVTADNHLNSTLQAMGMSQAFGPSADFSGITTQESLDVETVEQRDYLQVTPIGTKAAAVTGIGVQSTAAEIVPTIAFDRPFLFLVRDNATGTILFESMVQHP